MQRAQVQQAQQIQALQLAVKVTFDRHALGLVLSTLNAIARVYSNCAS
jgi:hypothetical protein